MPELHSSGQTATQRLLWFGPVASQHDASGPTVNRGAGAMPTLVGNGNLEGSVLQGVWMAVSGGGQD